MPLTVVPDLPSDDGNPVPGSAALIDQLVREGARRMLAAALQAEVDAYISAFADERDEAAAAWWCATAPTPRARS
nr:hypothetical protein GCM10020093_029890 [Planobispora longispora]